MIQALRAHDALPPALLRLSRLAPLEETDVATLAAVIADGRPVRKRRELLTEGKEIGDTALIVDGWAARSRILADGRRQFLSFLIPGDLIGLCRQSRPLAVSTVVALTDLTVCSVPPVKGHPALDEAYAVSHAYEEAYLLAHITRLGRLNAQERIADLFLELYERFSLVGLVSQNGFALPLTQEALADALGLTSVHVNRRLRVMRREGDIKWESGRLTMPDPAALARKIGRPPVRVSALCPPTDPADRSPDVAIEECAAFAPRDSRG